MINTMSLRLKAPLRPAESLCSEITIDYMNGENKNELYKKLGG